MFEEWQMFLLAMEIFRFYEADLVVAMVDSIVTEVYEMMKFYEKDGLLKIQSAFRMNNPVGTKPIHKPKPKSLILTVDRPYLHNHSKG